jgi:Phosphate-selective porin O and P
MRWARSASLVVPLSVFFSAHVSAQSQPGGEQPPEQPAPPAEPPETFPSLSAGKELRLGENFSIRPGIQLQYWNEALQDRVRQPNGETGDYQWNTYLRRTRLFFGGTVFKKASYFIMFDAPNLGRTTTAPDGTATKNFNTLVIQDAFLSLNLLPEFSIQAGLMVLPFSRQTLQSTLTYLSLDTLATSATVIAATQTSALRDTGVQFKGIIAEQFEYRVGVLQGIRQSSEQMGAQGGKNSFRLIGYLQYNFLDPESGYIFNGQHFGHKNILGVGVGFDHQKLDGAAAYWAASATAYASLRLKGDAKSGGDSLDGLVQFLHFDPGTTLPPGVAQQNDIGAELAYYDHGLSVSLFGKFEQRINSKSAFEAADLRIIGGGLKYFLVESNANVTFAYNRIETPHSDPATTNSVNQFVVALQLFYY